MLFKTNLEHYRKHYHLDELHVETDYDKPHTSPCGKYTEYEYQVFVRRGEMKFIFHSAVHWQKDEIDVPWYLVLTRMFVGRTIVSYSVNHEADHAYVIDMIRQGLESDDESD